TMSPTATTSTSFPNSPCSCRARKTRRPIRPKPLMAMRVLIAFSRSFGCEFRDLRAGLYMTRGASPSQSRPGHGAPRNAPAASGISGFLPSRAPQQDHRRAGTAGAGRGGRERHDAGARGRRAGQPRRERRPEDRRPRFRVLAAPMDDQHRPATLRARSDQEPLGVAQPLVARAAVKVDLRLGAWVAAAEGPAPVPPRGARRPPAAARHASPPRTPRRPASSARRRYSLRKASMTLWMTLPFGSLRARSTAATSVSFWW